MCRAGPIDRYPDIYDAVLYPAKNDYLLVMIKHPANHIIDHEKSGPAGCT